MAGSVNKAILIGHLGKDPEIKTTQQGGKLATFSLATTESWKDKNGGGRQQRTQWHTVVVFNEHIVGVVERFLKKGSLVHVEGQIETRKWTDKDGKERWTTEIVLRPFRGEVTMLDSKGGGGGEDGPGSPKAAAVGATQDEEIPF